MTLLERVDALQKSYVDYVAASDAYNARLIYEREIASWPPRMGNLYEVLDDAKRHWLNSFYDFAKSGGLAEVSVALMEK